MLKVLNNGDILKEKPKLKLCPNHYTYTSTGGRTWNPKVSGQAIKSGDWYKNA